MKSEKIMENGEFRIVIEELTFKAIIGILEEERVNEQLVVVNCKIDYEGKENFINYAEVCDLIQNSIIENKFKLIEEAVEFIEKKLLEKYSNMKTLYLQIKKPEILKNALVGVEILRKY
ncbi:dihydroneopterin aldolase/7,8-dihydroneopterin epimerase [Lebetimonas natsushimae]|uniref:dihydroneopterin aldolase n=1 Tax=Lebetimonas natsushimae TaxID=1936991 RepID=A0A292YC00_9BACT|nr:dihydroneopterin aldolase [Lebetimonas natsushimae]GAX86915.1 dihydroneopterin aldolase/7,8-dihydroneopterin epimerase [Lebetimonas natsushimae]